MKTPSFIPIKQHNTYQLPAALIREIGRVIVRWSYVEHELNCFFWALVLKGDEHGAAIGRLAMPKVADCDLIARVAEIRRFSYDKDQLDRIKKQMKTLSEQRNLLAHGIWTNTARIGWAVQQTRGAWDERPGGPKGVPEAVPMGVDDVRNIVSDLDALIADTTKFVRGV